MATAIHQYEDKLLDFAYGELPAPEASAVESHVKSCSRCTQALDQIRGVRTTMSALPQVSAPTAGLESLLAYADQAARRSAQAPRAAAPWWRRVIAPLAGACALVLVAVVAWHSQDDLGQFSKQNAALEATRQREAAAENHAAPVAAPLPEQPQEKFAEQAKAGKVAGAAKALEALPKNDRGAKEDRNWDAEGKKGREQERNPTQQALGATQAPGDGSQAAQKRELGSALNTAMKESKTRRVANNNKDLSPNDELGKVDGNSEDKVAQLDARPAPPAGLEQDSANARGGYFAEKSAKKKGKGEPTARLAEEGRAEPQQQQQANEPTGAPFGASTATPVAAQPRPPNAEKPPAPPAVVAQAQPQPQAPMPSSLGLGLNQGNSTGGGGLGSTSAPGPVYKQSARDDQRDESVAMADRKGEAELQKRDQEQVARGYIDAARAAGNSGNRQEEVKQSLAVVTSNVRGVARGEALERLCNALEALGNEDAADKYCAMLLREYPNSVAAKLLAQRRNRTEAPPKAMSKKAAPAYDSERSAEPSGESPAKAKKASDERAVDAY